jgi:hypothetical protein
VGLRLPPLHGTTTTCHCPSGERYTSCGRVLNNQVRDPDEDDWLKLKRLLKYIRSTIYMSLILRVESMNAI